MDVLRTVAHPMLGAMFVYGGLDSARQPQGKVSKADSVVDAVTETLGLPGDTATWVRVNGVAQVVAGTALSFGKFPRLAALVLAGSLVPTTLAGHRFWEESDAKARAGQRIHFLKNLSLFGALLLAADDTGGRPSIPWRIHEAVDNARDALPLPLT